MKKEKGFTLAELLGVIVILGLLMLLVFPAVINQLKEGKSAISSAVQNLIFNSTGNYIDGHQNLFSTSSNVTYCITLEELVNADEIQRSLLIDENGKELDLKKKVEVKIVAGKKSYQMNDNCVSS